VREGLHSVGRIVGELVKFAEEEVDVELVGCFEDEGLKGGESGLEEEREEKCERRVSELKKRKGIEGRGDERERETHLDLADRNESFGSTEGDHGRVGRDGEGSFEELESFLLFASTFEDLHENATKTRVGQMLSEKFEWQKEGGLT